MLPTSLSAGKASWKASITGRQSSGFPGLWCETPHRGPLGSRWPLPWTLHLNPQSRASVLCPGPEVLASAPIVPRRQLLSQGIALETPARWSQTQVQAPHLPLSAQSPQQKHRVRVASSGPCMGSGLATPWSLRPWRQGRGHRQVCGGGRDTVATTQEEAGPGPTPRLLLMPQRERPPGHPEAREPRLPCPFLLLHLPGTPSIRARPCGQVAANTSPPQPSPGRPRWC